MVLAFCVRRRLTQDHKDFHLCDFWLNLYALSLLSFAFSHAVTRMTSHGVSLRETCARFLNSSLERTSLPILSVLLPVGSLMGQETHAQSFLEPKFLLCCCPTPPWRVSACVTVVSSYYDSLCHSQRGQLHLLSMYVRPHSKLYLFPPI